MDEFADGMVARGPTLTADRATWTGSLHIVDLASIEAAREFVEREPYNRAGLFAGHLVLRFENLLGRTMWEFAGPSSGQRYLVIAQLSKHVREHAPGGPKAGLTALPPQRLIVHGELRTPEEAMPAGFALALQAPNREAANALVKAALNERLEVETHDWEFGGRR